MPSHVPGVQSIRKVNGAQWSVALDGASSSVSAHFTTVQAMGLERLSELDAATEGQLQTAHERLGGQMWTKVRLSGDGIGHWSSVDGLYLDAIVISGAPARLRWADDPTGFDHAVESAATVTAVVARGYADRTIFGLLLAAQDLLGLRFPDLRSPIGGIALAEPGRHDSNMDWVYHRHGFSVIEVEAVESR